jgi:hypothetical protein
MMVMIIFKVIRMLVLMAKIMVGFAKNNPINNIDKP